MFRKAHSRASDKLICHSTCGEILCSSHCKLVIAIVLLICTVIPYISVNMPLSSLYTNYHEHSEQMDLANELNVDRFSKALRYFNSSDSEQSQAFYNSRIKTAPEVVVCIVTINRDTSRRSSGYLVQTGSAVDSIIKSDTYFRDTVLFICNVDSDPRRHSDAVFVSRYIPFVEKYGGNSLGRTYTIHDLNNFTSIHAEYARRREFEDYVYCMNVSKSFHSKYVLMLEDDVIPYENVLKVIHYTITQYDLRHSSREEIDINKGRQFALKLFYPLRWQGYALELDRIIELVSISVVGGGILLAFVSLYTLKSEHSYFFKLFYFTVGTMLTMLSVSLIGRPNIMSLRRISPQLFKFSTMHGCCTQAVFYSTEMMFNLMQYLMTHSDMHKDLAISHYIRHNQIPGYSLEPNLFRHIGMYSSLNDAYKPPVEFIFDEM